MQVSVPERPHVTSSEPPKAPLRGAVLVGAATEKELAERLATVQREAREGKAPAPAAPRENELKAQERVAIDFGSPNELADKIEKALKALAGGKAAAWRPLRGQGIFRGSGPAAKVAFLFTGQGSQYVNMGRALRELEPLVAETFAQADRKMEPILGRTLSSYLFVDGKDAGAVAEAEEALKQTAITQPAVLATDLALARLLGAYGVVPDMVMGHSLGEYGALVAAGVLPFEDALEAVAARGREMSRVSVADNGKMAAVFAPLPEIERTLKGIGGYVVVANYNSNGQAVIGGATAAVETRARGLPPGGRDGLADPRQPRLPHEDRRARDDPVHDRPRAPADRGAEDPGHRERHGRLLPGRTATSGRKVIDLLSQQVASPVQFVQGLETLYHAGARIFVEVGPKRALQGFVEDVLGSRPDVFSLATNHPRLGDVVAFNQAVCGFYAAGLGAATAFEHPAVVELAPAPRFAPATVLAPAAAAVPAPSVAATPSRRPPPSSPRPSPPAAAGIRSATSASSSPSSSRRGCGFTAGKGSRPRPPLRPPRWSRSSSRAPRSACRAGRGCSRTTTSPRSCAATSSSAVFPTGSSRRWRPSTSPGSSRASTARAASRRSRRPTR